MSIDFRSFVMLSKVPLLPPALLVDQAELQSKDEFRKHYKTSEIISKIVRIWNEMETQMDLLKQGLL